VEFTFFLKQILLNFVNILTDVSKINLNSVLTYSRKQLSEIPHYPNHYMTAGNFSGLTMGESKFTFLQVEHFHLCQKHPI